MAVSTNNNRLTTCVVFIRVNVTRYFIIPYQLVKSVRFMKEMTITINYKEAVVRVQKITPQIIIFERTVSVELYSLLPTHIIFFFKL